MKKILLILSLAVLFSLSLRGEVFWLTPLGKGGSTGAVPLTDALPGLGNARPLFSEPVRVNGKNFMLEVFKSTAAFDEIIVFLKKRGVHFVLSRDTLRCTVIRGKNQLERILVVRSPGIGPVTVFRMAGSGGVPPVGAWPVRLPPLPPGTRPVQVIELPKRQGVYGVFEGGNTDPVYAFRSVDSLLRAQGWIPGGNEGSPLIGGSGDIYCNNRTREIMWVTCDAAGRGAFYCRKLRK